MSEIDPISVLESVYDLRKDAPAWLLGTLQALRPYADRGLGVWGFYFDGRGYRQGRFSYSSPTAIGPLPSDWVAGLEATFQVTASSPDRIERIIFSRPCQTMTEILGQQHPDLGRARERIAIPGVMDALSLAACDATGVGVFIGAHAAHTLSPTPVERALLGQLLAHVAAANRLRLSLGGSAGLIDSLLLDRAEAIIGPRGRIEHAKSQAATRASRDALTAAAKAVEQARRTTRRSDPGAALEAWRALFRGRWSIMDCFDSDGRRYIVAQANEPEPFGGRALLSRRERQVASLLSLGHTPKLIAYELGLASGTVSTVIARVRSKLGVRTMAELMRALHAPGEDDGDG